MSQPEVCVVRHLEELGSVRAVWDELYHASEQDSVFKSYDFAALWFRCFASPADVRVLTVWRGSRLIGVLPLVIVRQSGVRVLQSLTNDHCLHSDPLVLAGNEQAFQEAVLLALTSVETHWDILKHSYSYSFSQMPGLISRRMLIAEKIAWRDVVQPTYVVRLNKSFEEYVRSDISSNLRKSLARHRNRIRRCGTVTLERLRGKEGKNSWEEFVDIEDSGWKGQSGSSLRGVDATYGEFYRGLVSLMAAADTLQMYFLRMNGRYLAGSFSYVDGDVVHWYKTGYREEFAHLSPGNLLLIEIVEDLLKGPARCQLLHMFPWEHGYKHRFANDPASCIETILYNTTPRGRGMRFLDRIKRQLRSVLRRKPAD